MSTDITAQQIIDTLTPEQAELLEMLLSEQSQQQYQIETSGRDRGEATVFPCSFAQQRLWFITQLQGASATYNMPMAIRLTGSLNRDALEHSLERMVERHETLRTSFAVIDGEPRQLVAPQGMFTLRKTDLRRHREIGRERLARNWQVSEANEPFDLSSGPLARGHLIQLEDADHLLLITLHHIISDGWSVGVFFRELSDFYDSFVQEQPSSLAPLEIQYADYAQWQRGWLQASVMEEQLGYWENSLRGAPSFLELPTDRPRSAASRTHAGANEKVVIDAAITQALQDIARSSGLTFFMILLGGWALLLSRLSRQEDVLIGTPSANRDRPEVESLIGFFVNTLVLRLQVQPRTRLTDFLAHLRQTTLDAYQHQDLPFDRLVERMHPDRTVSRNPLFRVMFILQSAPREEIRFADVEARFEEEVYESAMFDLMLSLEELGGRVVGTLNYSTDLFDRSTIQRWLAAYLHLLSALAASPGETLLSDLGMMSAQEQLRALAVGRGNLHEASGPELIHRLFEEQVEESAGAVAVEHEGRVLTYAELNSQANQLARHLIQRGVRPDDVVGICVDRSVQMIVGLLGILKCGAAYLPLDPHYPADRLHYMVVDAAPRLILTQQAYAASLAGGGSELLMLEQTLQQLADLPQDNPLSPALSAENLLYLIYTSGSTGKPKGTAMPHRAMANLMQWHRRSFGSAQGRRVLQFAALSFDVAFQETFSTLCGGGTLVLVNEAVRRDAPALWEHLTRQRIDRLFVPPLMLQSLAECLKTTQQLPPLRDVITAGEQLRISTEIQQLFTQLPRCRLHNHYGPTETHVVTALTLSDDPQHWPVLPSIGRPISNTHLYVLDPQQQPVLPGVAGEIYIGGANLARGYRGQPQLTTQRFVADPYSADPRARLYKTGDLGRWCADGTLEYLGRNDDQVKIRGFRIELGEIEAQLARHGQVREAAVVAREETPGHKRLVAYFTVRDAIAPTLEDLHAHLSALLPEYMVPGAFVQLEHLPLTPSGKLNRRELPAPDIGAFIARQYEPPQGAIEEQIATLWQQLLQLERVGRHDNFFQLGGHSLLVMRMLFKLNELRQSHIKATDVYQSPTLRELAARFADPTVATVDFIDVKKETQLREDIVALPGTPHWPPRNVLVTGVTGFVGRFVLSELLQTTEAHVYCFVRAGSDAEAARRLTTVLRKWDLWKRKFERRITVLSTDLAQPMLGVAPDAYEHLSQSLDAIFHCATSMNHLETYATARAANVDAVQDLLTLATRCRPKVLHHISTLGIFVPGPGHVRRQVSELTDIRGETHLHSNGYLASKWISEQLVLSAADRGIPCNVYRLGFVWADREHGRYDELQEGYRLLKTCLMTGYGITDFRWGMAPIPVDHVARAVLVLASQHRQGRGVFHLTAEAGFNQFFERCNETGCANLTLLSQADWVSKMRQLQQNGLELPIAPLLEFYEHPSQPEFEQPHVQCSMTDQQIVNAGSRPDVLDDALLRQTVEAMTRRDPYFSVNRTISRLRAT